MVKTPTPSMVIIGRAEPLCFVDLSDKSVPAKVDSGAFRSSVHASDIQINDGVLSATLLASHPAMQGQGIVVSTSDFKEVGVVNSFGVRELRYELKLKAKLAGQTFMSSFTLANRSKNTFPILLGRTFLNKRFIIDTSKTSINRIELKMLSTKFPNDANEELS